MRKFNKNLKVINKDFYVRGVKVFDTGIMITVGLGIKWVVFL